MDHSLHKRQLTMVSTDHEILAEAIEKLRQHMLDGRGPDWQAEITAFLALANERLPRHFRQEDQFVFPAILARDRSDFTVRMVETLKEGHQDMLTDLEELNVLLKSPQTDPGGEVLWKKLQEFIDDLYEHTRQEDYFFGKGYPEKAPVPV